LFEPGLVRLTRELADGAGAPPDYLALALLAAAGSVIALGRRAEVWPGWLEPPVLWAALVGPPSAGKSPALAVVRGALHDVETELNADHAERLRELERQRRAAELARSAWEAEAAEAAKRGLPLPALPAAADPPEPVKRRRLLINDATTEAIVAIGASNPYGIAAFHDELAAWLGGMGRYGAGGRTAGAADRGFWLSSHRGEPVTVDRVRDGGNPVHVHSLAVSVIGGVQPARLQELLLSGPDDGLPARLLYAWPDRPAGDLGPPRSAPDLERLRRVFRRLAALPRATGPDGRATWRLVPFTDGARGEMTAFRRWCRDREAELDGHALPTSWLGKLPGIAARVALACAYANWADGSCDAPEPNGVGLEGMRLAIAFLRSYCWPMARAALGDAARPPAERDAATIAKWLLQQQPAIPETIGLRDLQRARVLPGGADVRRYTAALEELAEAAWVSPAFERAGPTPGRPRRAWAVNPLLGDLADDLEAHP
jgi:putative DNA primase/helicase